MSALEDMTPHQAWYGKKPGIKHLLSVWKYCLHAHSQKESRGKLDSKNRKCILVGCGSVRKSYTGSTIELQVKSCSAETSSFTSKKTLNLHQRWRLWKEERDSLIIHQESVSFEEAISSPERNKWKQAMDIGRQWSH